MISFLIGPASKQTTHRLRWYGAVWLGMAATGAHGAPVEQVRPRFPITSAQIVNAMQQRQLPTEAVNVTIAAPITSSIARPELAIQSIALVGTHSMRLRMACRNHSECPAFFVLAEWPEAAQPAKLPVVPETRSIAVKAKNIERPSEQQRPSPSADPSAADTPEHEPILKVGSRAMLAIDGDRVHVLVEVVCLENGSIGDKIRVTTRDHKQSYVAEIVTPALLKGSL